MEKTVELHALDDEVLDHRRKSSVPSKPASDFDRDRYELARAGKQQVLKVSLSNTCRLSRRLITNAASIRSSEHDRIIMRIDVHLGDIASVGPIFMSPTMY
jgi:hypothetical protein